MRFQFSILTMLICTAVLAAVCAVSVKLSVVEVRRTPVTVGGAIGGPGVATGAVDEEEIKRPPIASEIIGRMIYWGLPAVAATLFLLWLIRRNCNPLD